MCVDRMFMFCVGCFAVTWSECGCERVVMAVVAVMVAVIVMVMAVAVQRPSRLLTTAQLFAVVPCSDLREFV